MQQVSRPADRVLSIWRPDWLAKRLLPLIVMILALVGPGFGAIAHAQSDTNTTIEPGVTRIGPGGTIGYNVRVAAPRDAGISHVRVVIPYDRQQLVPIDSRFAGRDGYVSELFEDRLVVSFKDLDADGEREGTIFFLVSQNLPQNTPIVLRAGFYWKQENHSRSRDRTAPTVRVIGALPGPPRTTVIPDVAGAGTARQIEANNFLPGEAVITWLNTPGGVQALDLRPQANELGEVGLTFDTGGLPPGAYSLVLYGSESQQTGVAAFIVQ